MPTQGNVWDEVWAEVQAAAALVDVDRATFIAHLEQVADVGFSGQLRGDDLVLALACARGNEAALRRFDAEILSQTDGALRRLQEDGSFVDEVKQRVRERLLVSKGGAEPKIKTYVGRGVLAGWVTVTAVRTAMSLLREQARAHRFGEERWAAALALPNPGDEELTILKQRYKDAFSNALVRAARELQDRERTMLKLSFAEGLSIDRIAVVYGVHRATVARWITKAKDELISRTQAILVRDEGIEREELMSLQRLVRSQLEMSLTGLFS